MLRKQPSMVMGKAPCRLPRSDMARNAKAASQSGFWVAGTQAGVDSRRGLSRQEPFRDRQASASPRGPGTEARGNAAAAEGGIPAVQTRPCCVPSSVTCASVVPPGETTRRTRLGYECFSPSSQSWLRNSRRCQSIRPPFLAHPSDCSSIVAASSSLIAEPSAGTQTSKPSLSIFIPSVGMTRRVF